jgi:protocatechuate 3,4-dioxygenase beta subunit
MRTMTRTPARYTLLIALSLLTAAIAIVGAGQALASEQVHDERSAEPGPRNLTLSGTLTDAETGEPVEDVEITVTNMWTGEDGDVRGRDRFTATTDADGRYAVDVSEGRLEIRLDPVDHQRADAGFEIDDDVQLDVPLEPVSEDLARVEGTVTDDDGEPIADASVRINAISEDCKEDERCEAAERTAREEGSARTVETSQGNVTINYHPVNDRYVHTDTDEDGRYQARLPAGHYGVRARAEDHLPARTQVDVSEGEEAQVDLALTAIPPASVTVEGQLVDRETGEPVPGAEVELHNQRWGTRTGTMTDGDGRYSVEVEPGYTIVQFRADEHQPVACEPHDAEHGDGTHSASCEAKEREQLYLPVSTVIQPNADETVTLDEQLGPEPEPSAKIDGWVVNATSGEAIANASLQFVNEETGEWGHAETGEDGSFRIGVDEGYYTVRVRAAGYYGNATNVEVDDRARLTVELTPGETRHSRCCYTTPVEDRAYESDGAGGGDAEAQSTPGGSGGSEAYAGGPAELGAPPTVAGDPMEPPVQPTPSVGVVGVLASLAAAVVLVRTARR